MYILTPKEARDTLNQTMDDVCRDHEPIVIARHQGQHVVLLSLEDYNSMNETIYLLGTTSNSARLRQSIAQVKAGMTRSKAILSDISKRKGTR